MNVLLEFKLVDTVWGIAVFTSGIFDVCGG